MVDFSKASKTGYGSVADWMKREQAVTVVISGYRDAKEKKKISLMRATQVKDSLVKYGVAASRITVVDKGVATDGKAPVENMKATFSMYSTSPKSLERLLNTNAPLTLQVTDGAFQKGDNKMIDKIEWIPGENTIVDNGRSVWIIVQGIEQPRLKTLEEARGPAISDYQNTLEKTWIQDLKTQYPVKLDEAVFKGLVKK